MRVLTVDPGMTGALALMTLETPAVVDVIDMPTAGDEVDVSFVARQITEWAPDEVLIERVGPMKGDGAIQAFRFGGSYLAVKTVCLLGHVPMRLVTPPMWKKHFRLVGGEEGKEQSRALALQRFPSCAHLFSRKKDHNRAEAALLTLYYREKLWARVMPQDPMESTS